MSRVSAISWPIAGAVRRASTSARSARWTSRPRGWNSKPSGRARLLLRVQGEVTLVDGPAVEGDLYRPGPGEVVLSDVGAGHRQRRHEHCLALARPAGPPDLVRPALDLHRPHRRRRLGRHEGLRHRLIHVAIRRLKLELRPVGPRQPRPDDADLEIPHVLQHELPPPGLADRLFALAEEHLP